ncbi:MAG TPA: lipoyl(octanoyl) transferase [Phycisphaerales bacterium]|nr:lipoyl(octanoyl) transferase [Phycisphaerales bacterium]HMP37848.1 lipoyl(octanoyl) transferase [Phycisphaerales bacterium]
MPAHQPIEAPEFVDLGQMSYDAALAVQRAALEEAIGVRERGSAREGRSLRAGRPSEPGEGAMAEEATGGEVDRSASGWPGRILLVEHVPAVITVTRRPEAAGHVLATAASLAARGIELRETDRGGDVTYHGPGQLVVYPLLDLNRLGLRIHGYMRLLEEIVIRVLARFDLQGVRDPAATGVWVESQRAESHGADRGWPGAEDATAGRVTGPPQGLAKICAMGVRVSRWVSMHGLALNVACDLDRYRLIVPCGLAGRAVTSMEAELGAAAPAIAAVKAVMIEEFRAALATLPKRAADSLPDRDAAKLSLRIPAP